MLCKLWTHIYLTHNGCSQYRPRNPWKCRFSFYHHHKTRRLALLSHFTHIFHMKKCKLTTNNLLLLVFEHHNNTTLVSFLKRMPTPDEWILLKKRNERGMKQKVKRDKALRHQTFVREYESAVPGSILNTVACRDT